MTTVTIRAGLTGNDIPFLFRDSNRTVLIPGIDPISNQNYKQENQDWNSPHVLYVENVMPISKGLVSTSLQQVVNPSSAFSGFDQAIILRDKEENNALLVPSQGKNYLLNSLGTWVSVSPFAASKGLITRAYTQGRSFVCYERQKIFEYAGVAQTLTDVTGTIVLPAGYTIADIRGIGGASNYLLLFTKIDILWSSPNDPLNFNRLLNNGSGYQVPQDLRGQISCILPVAGGAIIYTVRNAVAAVFTNNAATPFLFRGISNSGGVSSYEQVAYDADEQFQYIWSSGGMQAVNLQSAINTFPELTDFLTSGVFEHFDYTTNKIVSIKTGANLAVKLTYVSQRFLVVSFGRSRGSYEFAWIHDSALKRWGKVKVAHVDAFTFPYPNLNGALTYAELTTTYAGLGDASYTDLGVGVTAISPPKRSIAFMSSTGLVSVLSMEYSSRSQQGVAVLGHIQQNRGNYTTVHRVDCEGIDQSTPAKLYVYPSADGKTVDRVVEFLTYEPIKEDWQSFQGRETAINHTFALIGAFQWTGCLIKFSKHAKS